MTVLSFHANHIHRASTRTYRLKFFKKGITRNKLLLASYYICHSKPYFFH